MSGFSGFATSMSKKVLNVGTDVVEGLEDIVFQH